jgi:glucokinase
VADAAGLFAMAHAGDAIAQSLVERVAQRLGQGIALLVDLLNPECVVLGGIFPRQEALLRPQLEATLAHEGLPAAVRACRILPAQLGERVGDYAALAAALEHST